MDFLNDLEIIEEVTLALDPAFRAVPADQLHARLSELKKLAGQGVGRDEFLLAAMRVVALAGNGHSRVIPNDAVSVFPHRVVLRDGGLGVVVGGHVVPVALVNETPVPDLMDIWSTYLAGTAARRSMLSGIMLVWPAALALAGIEGDVRYHLSDGNVITCAKDDVEEARGRYPTSDPGFADLSVDPYALTSGGHVQWQDDVWRIRIADLKAVSPEALAAVPEVLATGSAAGVVVDLRGNPGGDFTKAIPLIDWMATEWRGARCAVLVDSFTFSAAIVVAVLLAHRLQGQVQVIGQDMGDDLRFFAEGDTFALPDSGAALRYSTALHDWRGGVADDTTPAVIAQHLVAAQDVPVCCIAHRLQDATAIAFARNT